MSVNTVFEEPTQSLSLLVDCIRGIWHSSTRV